MKYALVFLVGAIMAWLLTYAWHRSLEDKCEVEEETCRCREDKPRPKPPERIAFVNCVLGDGTERSISLNDVTWSETDNGQLFIRTTTAEHTWAPGRWVECIVREVEQEEA